MKKAIFDASVAVKWFSMETGSARADALLAALQEGRINAYAPDLLICEVANALGRGKQLDEDRVQEAIAVFFDSRMTFVGIDRALTAIAARFMVQYRITFYDAVYGALASALDAPLVTADPKDHKKVQEIRVIDLATLPSKGP